MPTAEHVVDSHIFFFLHPNLSTAQHIIAHHQVLPCRIYRQNLTEIEQIKTTCQITKKAFYRQDVTLMTSLLRPSSMFVEDLVLQQPYTKERYGSARKVYVVCTEDHAIAEGFQRWMVENSPVDEVREIVADHLVMLSRPSDLVRCLADIADNYA